jgi:DMSO/TMAO reductase YedYZ molybdopterin-dependent catalytic subunit
VQELTLGTQLPPPTEGPLTFDELRMAARNHALPLEALRYPITPVGLHYVLVHYDIPGLDAATWRLSVDGEVNRPLSLSLNELRALPSVEVVSTMECAGNGRALLSPRPVSQPWLLEAVGTGRWRGVAMRTVLELAGLRESAADVVATGLDRGLENEIDQRYQRALPLAEALRDEVVLAYELNGGPLPPQHGFPLRLVVPGWYGMTNVKWLGSLTVTDEPFAGYQHARSYRLRLDPDEDGVPVTRMLPRSLLAPPGVPDFLTRERFVDATPVRLEGRAWSGQGRIVAVEVSDDDGASWAPAELTDELGSPWAWRGWTHEWDPAPGRYALCCRATDDAGNVQPLEPVWNLGGYANNAVQRVPVTVVG